MVAEILIDTPLGPARVHVLPPSGRRRRPAGTLALGHGAGGGTGAVDLQAVAGAAAEAGWQVLLVDQPWRVAGKRVAPAPPRLDLAWTAVLEALGGGTGGPAAAGIRLTGPLVLGGRSAGARVACRTAGALGAAGVCLLAFPLHPPGRPERSRAGELTGAGVPALVVQGRSDPFGGPQEVQAAVDAAPDRAVRDAVTVVAVAGDHGLAAGAAAAADAVAGWLGLLTSSTR